MESARLLLLAALLSLTLAVTASSATAAAPTSSRPSAEAKASACPTSIRLGGKRFAFYRRGVTYKGARTAIRRLYASYGRRGTPRGFKCRSRSRFRKTGGCATRGTTRYFGFSR